MPRTRSRSSVRAREELSLASADQREGGLGVGGEEPFGRPQAHADRDQPGLRPVVQVPLDPAQFGGRGVHGVAAGPGQGLHPLGQLLGPGRELGVGREHLVLAHHPRRQPQAQRRAARCPARPCRRVRPARAGQRAEAVDESGHGRPERRDHQPVGAEHEQARLGHGRGPDPRAEHQDQAGRGDGRVEHDHPATP